MKHEDTHQQLIKQILNQPHSFTTNDLRNQTADTRSKRSHLTNKQVTDAVLLPILSGLVNLGLLEEDRRRWRRTATKTLQGTISFNRQAAGFVKTAVATDIFIPSTKVGEALPGDQVSVRIIDFARDRFVGEIARIIKRGRQAWYIKVEKKIGNSFQGRMLDLPLEVTGYFPEKVLSRDISTVLRQNVSRSATQEIILKCAVKTGWIFRQKEIFWEVQPTELAEFSGENGNIKRVLTKHNIPQDFPENILADLHFDPNGEVTEKMIRASKMRKDLRDLFTITVDGDTAKDFDDAISIKREKNRYRLFVHIADVSYYVPSESILDQEARMRGTSVYLGRVVVPMLPFVLSDRLCSLQAGSARLALTCEMVIEDKSIPYIKSYEFYNSVIQVDKRHTYASAAADQTTPEISLMQDLADKLKAGRRAAGKLELFLPENIPVFDQNGAISGFETKAPLKSHYLIEEFMLSANICAAEFLKKKGIASLHREHEAMDEEKIHELNQFLELFGVNHRMETLDNSAVQLILDKIRGTEHENTFNYLLLRSFKQAFYDPGGIGHWALGFEHYAHFTSPIRRYPDLIVHRCIKRAIGDPQYKHLEYGLADLQALGKHVSLTERRAMDAERDLARILACQFMRRFPLGTLFVGRLIGINPRSLFVQLNDFPVEGVISSDEANRGDDFDQPNPFMVIISGKRQILSIGDAVQVKLNSADEWEMKIKFGFMRKVK